MTCSSLFFVLEYSDPALAAAAGFGVDPPFFRKEDAVLPDDVLDDFADMFLSFLLPFFTAFKCSGIRVWRWRFLSDD
jgi:hypothetical protein